MAPVSSNLQNSYAPELAPTDGPEVVPEENFPEAVNAAWFAASKHLPFDHTVEPKRPTSIRDKRIFLFVLLALGAIVVLGVALGAGLGVGLKDSHSAISASNLSTSASIAVSSGTSTSSATQSAVTSGTSTSSATQSAVTSGTTGIAAIPCTEDVVGVSNNYTWTQSQIKTVFTEVCNTDWPSGSTLNTGSGTVKDLQKVVRYTFNSCMDACALFNANPGANNELCTAVVYNWNLTSSVAGEGGNCFLKNGRGDITPVVSNAAGAFVVSNSSSS